MQQRIKVMLAVDGFKRAMIYKHFNILLCCSCATFDRLRAVCYMPI